MSISPTAAASDPALVGIDVGTQSIRAIAFDPRGRKIAAAGKPTPTNHLPGGGEYDPDLIFETVLALLAEIGQTLAGRPVAGIAVASLGESSVLIGADGQALAPAILWFDKRTDPYARAITDKVGKDRIFAITGLSPEPIFSLFKLAWIRDHWPEALRSARRNLMMADWIAFRLSGEAATDPSLASRTLYFDIHRRQWSEELLAVVGLDPSLPAPLAPSATALGPVKPDILAATGIAGRPIVGVGGHDHIIGSFAAGLVGPGILLDSIGTAEALLLATTEPLADPAVYRQGYFQSAAGVDRPMSYLGGGMYSSGGTMEWFRAVSGGADIATIIAEAAAVPAGSGGVVFLPQLANAAPPQIDDHARGAFVGLSLATGRGALFRAVIEGLAMQARMVLDGMVALTGLGQPREIRVIGGGSRNRLLLSVKANVFGRPIVIVDEAESTALGAALLGGIAAGLFPSLDAALAQLERRDHLVMHDADADHYARLQTMVFEHVHDRVKPINRSLFQLQASGGVAPG